MLHDTEKECENKSVRFVVRIRDEETSEDEGSIAEVKEMVESPSPSPVQETSTEFSDLLHHFTSKTPTLASNKRQETGNEK